MPPAAARRRRPAPSKGSALLTPCPADCGETRARCAWPVTGRRAPGARQKVRPGRRLEAIYWTWSSGTNPRIKQAINEVGDQIGHHDRCGQENKSALQHGEIQLPDG